ncbi:hypothetical protein FDP41_011902 [Naegleria fowleri]|uniref:PH domain-containing protein n=1 Tax=Naegleria fowleri TaxID=5763 RepID=A0A6A5C4L7_NAEFO|nr:uncharacterized protein FDP41_011902 [Naegleria fowleri]KAF0982041.1 hypothetical protein FDP41_011902 [Naegleria fowleri]
MVIEDLVSRIMVPYLQQYVDNFDKKNLNIAVLKGVASLKDVKLKEYALDNISDTIPFYISFSHISLLEFDVPYTSLNAKSVVCSLKDVYIVLRPKMKRPYNQDEEKQRQRELKRYLLDQFEKQQLEKEKQKENQEKTEEGFFDKLIETVLNNLKIKLENIHIRFQDDDNCVAGFSLDSMEVNSTDSSFEKKFQKNLGELTYKLLTMQKLSIYLNPWSEQEKIVNDCIQNRMMSDQEIIQKINSIQNRVYLLKPVDGCLKLTMQKLSASGIDLNKPQFNAVFEFMNDIQMCLSQNQYNSIFKIIEYLTNYSVQSQYRHFRPNKFDPLAYWKYAINCVMHQRRQERMSRIYEQTLADTCREYVRVYKVIVKVPWVQHKATPNDVNIFKKFEEERSIQEILYFRKCAHKEINQEAKNFEENKKRKSSWFSTEKLQEKAIELSDKVKEELYKSIGFEESAPVVMPDDYVKVQVHVDLAKLSFLVYHEKSDLMELVVDRFVSDIQVLPHKAFRVSASMGNFTLYDRFSGTLYPEFITKSKRWSEAASSNLLSMFLERRSPIEKKENESDIYFSLNLDQIDIVVNFEFFQRILSFLYFDSVNIKRLEKEAKRQIKKVSKMAKKEIKEVLMQDDTTVDLSLNIKAPQLIIPWSVSDPNSRFLLIDFGMFTLKKDTSVPLREKFDINMENMEIIVPFDINAVGYLSNELHIDKYDVILEKASFSASAMKYKSANVEEKVQVIVNVPCINFVLSKESMVAVAVLTQQIAEFNQNPTGTKQKINDLKIMGSLLVNHDDSGFAPFFVEVSSTKKIFFYSDESKKYLKIIAHLNSHTKVWKSDKYENTFCVMLPQKKGYQTKYIYLQCSSAEEMENWVTTLTMFIYSFNTNFFVDDFADILKEVSFSDDEEEEEKKEGILIAIRFNLNSFILSLSHHDVNLASVNFSNLQAYFRQYHNLDSNLSLHLHTINVKSEVIKDRDFYLIKSIESQSDQDEKEHLVNVNFTRSIDPTSPIYDPTSQMKLNVAFKSLHCFVEPAILSSFIDYGYDLQDILDQITAFNKINYYSFVPDEDEKDTGQKFSDLARMLLEGNETSCKLLTMQLVAGESNMLILNNGATIAEVVINSGTNVSCFVDLETITISGNLRNIQLLDHSEPTSLYKEILGLYDNSQDSVVTLTYKYVFSSISLAELVEQDPERDLIQRGSINYRQFLSMDTSAIKYVHIQRFYRKAQSYISGPLLNALKRESTRNRINFSGLDGKDIISKRIINNQIKLNIKITSPVVIFPSNFQSKDHFLAHLGNLEVENFLIGDSSNPVDHVKVLLNDIMLEFVSSASSQREKILSDIHIKVNVKKPIITPFTKTKQNNEFDIAKEVVNVDFSDIVFNLTHSQYQTIFDFINGNIRDGMRDINEERKFYQSIGKLVTRRKKKDIMMKRVTSERAIDSMSSSIIITDVHVTAPQISLVILKKNGSNFAKLAVTDLQLNNKIDINECIRLQMTLGSIIASDMRSNTSNVFSNFIEFSDPTACFSLQYENDRLQFKEKVNLKLSDPKIVVIPELLLDFRHFFSDTHYFQNDTLDELLLVGTTVDETAEYDTILEQNETPEEIEIKAKLELKGDFGTPRVIIPENSEDSSSKLLVLKFSSELDFNATQIGKSEKGVFKITGLTVIVTHGTSSLPLLEPTNIDVAIMRLKSQEDVNGPKEERVIRVSISEGASARLSYHDVKMLYTIAEQFKQKLEMPSALSQQDITSYLQEVENSDVKPHTAPIIAKDFKKMISEELLPQTLVNKFIIESKTMSVLVVDDLSGFDIPIIRLHLSGFRFNSMIKSFSTNESNISAYLELLIHGDCYNFKLAEWEPIIEKNKVPIHCMYQNQKEHPKHIVQVECDDIIDLNVTYSSLETILSTAQAWAKELKRETVSKIKKLAITFEPFSIVNKCGLAISFKVANDFVELEQDKEVRFSFPTNAAEKKNFVTLQIGPNTIKTLVNKNGIYPHSLILKDKELGQLEYQIYIEVKDKKKRKLIIIHSGCKVRNKTDKYWQIGCHVGEKILPLAFLAPYSSLYIPSQFVVEDGCLAIRPCKDQVTNDEALSSEYKWTSNDPTVYSLKSFRKTHAKTILSRNKHMTIKKDHMYCILHSKSVANNKTRISIIPPLAIQNVLQEDVQFALFGSSSKDANVRIAKYSDTIQKGDTKYIYKIDMQKPKMWIQSIINGWQTKDITLIYTYGDSQEETCNTFSNFFMDGRIINLRYDVFSTENAYVKIVIYCPYLIMNNTQHDFEVIEVSKENYKLGCCTTIDGIPATMFNYYSESSSMIFSKKVFLKSSQGFVSNPFSIDSVGTPSELILYHESDKTKIPLNMGCFVSLAKGKYERTKIVEITPRYLLINDIHSKEKSVNIEVKQFGDDSNILTIAKQKSCHFYWTIDCNKLDSNEADNPLTIHFRRKKIPMICIRLKNVDEEEPLFSEWSIPFSIDTLGEIPLIIGSNYITTKIMQNNGCIQVSFTRAALPPYFIVNQTSHSISVSQVYTGENIVIAPNKTIPYMVPDIKSKHSIYVTLGEKFKLGAIDIDKIKKSKFIPIPQLKTSIFIRLTTYRGYTRVISFQEKDVKPNQQSLDADQDDSQQSLELFQSYFYIKGIGVSIINQNQTEILYAHADNISVNCNITENNKQLLEVKVHRMGIDNQLDHCTFPIMFTNANKLGLRDFLHFSLIMDTKEKEFDYIPYLSLLMQEAKIAIDFKLIHELLKMVSSLQGKKTNHEKQYIISKTTERRELDSHEQPPPSQHEEILSSFNYSIHLKSQLNDRMIYFELLQLHPIKLNLSFVFNEIPNDEEQDLSIILRTLGARLSMNIDEAPIRLNALILNHPPLSSRIQLVENIKAHYTRYAISEMFSILGSFDIIGNPVGLFNDIDKGVYDLFYEPMEGITKSPKEFTLGLAKGTTSFFKHSIHGTFNTASKVTESISNGISLLTLDEDYQTKRKEANHLSKRPKHIGEGLVSGAQSLSMGLLEAGTGLFVKPIEGASKEGISGFLKGVGKGIIGMPVKPITGVLDFVYKTSEGLKNTTQFFDREFQIHRKRFPRFVGTDKKLSKYDGNASFGYYVFSDLMKQGIIPNGSTYVSHYFLTSSNDVVFLSTQHIFQVSCLALPPAQHNVATHHKVTKYYSSQNPPKPENVLDNFTLTWIHEIKTISKLDCSRNNPNSIVLRVKSQTSWFGFGDLYDDVVIETEPHNNDLLAKLHQLHKF